LLISGASGAIGQVIVDAVMELNKRFNYNCKIVAMSRNIESARKVFGQYWRDDNFEYMSCDVTGDIKIDKKIDYIIHAASNTHPLQYSQDPIGTITANAFGTYNLLELAVRNSAEFLLLSSVEIYGENKSEKDKFSETDMGYLDCATLRAGYPESKRLAECMCYAFSEKKELKFKIVRLARVYGGTLKAEDSKAISQFFHKGLKKENIVLKSEGRQLYSYVYVMDCVSGIFAVLLNGKNREVYNIAGTKSTITLIDLANLIAQEFGVSVVKELPSQIESAGFSKATKAVLDNSKLLSLGWNEKTPIGLGIRKVKEQIVM
jgi:nucleoside-diphosphate-sugar epimerase